MTYPKRPAVLAALLALTLSVTAAAQETITLRAADNQPEDYPTVVGLRAMADYLSENSDGRIEMEIFAGGQLGDERSTIEQAQLGVIDVVRTSASPVGEFYAPMGIYGLPYLFRDEAHFVSVLQGEVGEELLTGEPGRPGHDGDARRGTGPAFVR